MAEKISYTFERCEKKYFVTPKQQQLLLNRLGSHIKPDAYGAYTICNLYYDAIILDIMMPKLNSIEVLQRLRSDGIKTPIMMLTAKGEKDDRITGFDAGADDYLPKPFAPDELICRVRAMLRRGAAYQPNALTFGDLTLESGSGILSCGGNSVRLSGREFQLMELFLRSPRVVFSADHIMEKLWGWDSDAEINVVWVHISNLRKKLKSIGSDVTIRSSRGLGYLLENKA